MTNTPNNEQAAQNRGLNSVNTLYRQKMKREQNSEIPELINDQQKPLKNMKAPFRSMRRNLGKLGTDDLQSQYANFKAKIFPSSTKHSNSTAFT
jgi:hypothetical protein